MLTPPVAISQISGAWSLVFRPYLLSSSHIKVLRSNDIAWLRIRRVFLIMYFGRFGTPHPYVSVLDGVCSPLLFSFVDAQLRQGPPNRCRACLHRAGDDFARGLARDHLPGASPRCRNEVRMVVRSLILISLLGQSAASSWIRAATYTCIPFQECVVCLVISRCFCLSTAKSASGAVSLSIK